MAKKKTSHVWVNTKAVGNIQEFLVLLFTTRFGTTSNIDDAYMADELPFTILPNLPPIFEKVPIIVVESRCLKILSKETRSQAEIQLATLLEEINRLRGQAIEEIFPPRKQMLLWTALDLEKRADEVKTTIPEFCKREDGMPMKFKNLHPLAGWCAADSRGVWYSYRSKPFINPLGGAPECWESKHDGNLGYLEVIRSDQKTNAFFSTTILHEAWETTLYEVSTAERQTWQDSN